ncbi:tetratricopeptide repeat protein [Nonomuraea typhae]|uniref:Tetratricopeptide repeat protein n=1 Tax=Nonomuraea typhae TaxID=2603600 RepID=A0ABW7Z9K0_9ACTN
MRKSSTGVAMEGDHQQTPSAFAEELQRLLKKRGLSWRGLAELVGYHPSWLSKIKNGIPPSGELARRCDEALEAEGNLIALAGAEDTRPPAQLPAPPARLVGRDRELAMMHEALSETGPSRDPVVIAVDGPPGAGKTALALRCAHDVKDCELHAFPDGELYSDLRGHAEEGEPVDPGRVLADFLVALGVREQDVPHGVEQRAKLYRSLLASRRVLIVLDNAASSPQVEPLLPGAGGCGVVVTSRRRLTGLAMRTEAERVELGPLTAESAREVLRSVIGGPRADEEGEALAALADQCGGLPLALRIAAERAVAHPHRSVGELARELADEDHRLDGLVTDDSVALRNVFAWSYRTLDEPDARLFRLLGLHQGPHLSPEAAAALAGVPIVTCRHMLERLVAANLVETVPSARYRMRGPLALYAAERAAESESPQDRDAAVSRLARSYLLAAAAAGETVTPSWAPVRPPDPGAVPPLFGDDVQAALRWCDAEAANLTPVARLAMEHGLPGLAWRLLLALGGYLSLLRVPGRMWLEAAALAREAARAARDAYGTAWAGVALAEAHCRLQCPDRARGCWEEVLALPGGDPRAVAWARAGLGLLAAGEGLQEASAGHARAALAGFQELNDRYGMARALMTVADSLRARRRYDDALRLLGDALRVLEDLGEHDGRGAALARMADVHLARDEYERALDLAGRSLEAHRQAGGRAGEADALVRRGLVLRAHGRGAEARTAWQEAVALYDAMEDPRAAVVRSRMRDDPGGRNPPGAAS